MPGDGDGETGPIPPKPSSSALPGCTCGSVRLHVRDVGVERPDGLLVLLHAAANWIPARGVASLGAVAHDEPAHLGLDDSAAKVFLGTGHFQHGGFPEAFMCWFVCVCIQGPSPPTGLLNASSS